MEVSDTILDLLERRNELKTQGEGPSPEQLCGDRRELVEPLREAIRQYDEVQQALGERSPLVDAPTLPADAVSTAGGFGPGSLVGKYELRERLGRGSFGEVWKAHDRALVRTVALKLLQPGPLGREPGAIARLNHPHVVQIYEVGDHQGWPYLALEFVPGGTLAARLDSGPLPPEEAARLAEALAFALDAAHRVDVVHRDVKPSNILLTAEGSPKLTDFGLAKHLDEPGQTQTGDVRGTPSYMAPEQAAGRTHEVGPASDVYGLGAVLYEMLTGRPPFQAATPSGTIYLVVYEEPVPVRALQPKLPRDLATICHGCLEKEPGHRFASAGELADDLGRFLRGEPIHRRPVGAVERVVKWARRRPAVAALIAVSVLAVAALTAGWLWHQADRAAFAKAEQERKRAADLVEDIRKADLRQVPALVARLDGLREHADPILLARLNAADATADEKVRIVVALLPVGESQTDDLRRRLPPAALELLREELGKEVLPDWADPQIDPSWAALSQDVRQKIEAADGLAEERFAFCQTLLLADFDALAAPLRDSGYQMQVLRPYRDGNTNRVAAVWKRGSEAVDYEFNLTQPEFKQRAADRQQKGFRPLDALKYVTPTIEVRYAVVWQRGKFDATTMKSVATTPLSVGVAESLLEGTLKPPPEAKLPPPIPFPPPPQEPYSVEWKFGGSFWAFQGAKAEALTGARLDMTLTDAVVLSPAEYRATWHRDTFQGSPREASREAVSLHGLDPRALRQNAARLARRGYRPVSISVWYDLATGKRLAASVWKRPPVSEAAYVAVASRQAAAACTLLRLGEADSTWPLFVQRSDPTARSWLIHSAAALGVDPVHLLNRYPREPDKSARRALLLAMGEFEPKAVPEDGRAALTESLLRAYRDEPDAGLHSAIDWLLRQRWGQAKELDAIDAELKGQRREGDRSEDPHWMVNRDGTTFTVIPGPVEFRMGSHQTEPDHRSREDLHLRRIERGFAIATRPVTVAEFERFLHAHPEFRQDVQDIEEGNPADLPVVHVTWFQAAAYCRWLSEQECSADQMCYPSLADIKDAMTIKDVRTLPKVLTLPGDYLSRTGYRLPSEAEWEYACRTGTETARHYGRGDELLGEYAWYIGNSLGRIRPARVGLKKPNDFGLFDMHGNVRQWTQNPENTYIPDIQATATDRYARYVYDRYLQGDPILDREWTDPVSVIGRRMLRGGAFGLPAAEARSAFRMANFTSIGGVIIGFRLARTIR